MASSGFVHCVLFFFMASAVLASSSSSISYKAMEPHLVSGRRALLQYSAKQLFPSCKVNFDKLNYTTLTSVCKGPNYERGVCCHSFKELMCPISGELNDIKTGCSEAFFGNIHRYYPEGFFFDLCKEGKQGISCEEIEETTTLKTKLPKVEVGSQFGVVLH